MQKLKNKFAALCVTMMMALLPIYSNAYSIRTSNKFQTQFNAFKEHYSIFITIFMSITLITSIAIFVYHCTMLAVSASNAQKRAEAMSNLLITGLCLSGQSAISVLIAIFFWGFYI